MMIKHFLFVTKDVTSQGVSYALFTSVPGRFMGNNGVRDRHVLNRVKFRVINLARKKSTLVLVLYCQITLRIF